jgi:hypothetical protein
MRSRFFRNSQRPVKKESKGDIVMKRMFEVAGPRFERDSTRSPIALFSASEEVCDDSTNVEIAEVHSDEHEVWRSFFSMKGIFDTVKGAKSQCITIRA